MKTANIMRSSAKLALMTCGLMLLGSDADSGEIFFLTQFIAAVCFCLFFKLNNK